MTVLARTAADVRDAVAAAQMLQRELKANPIVMPDVAGRIGQPNGQDHRKAMLQALEQNVRAGLAQIKQITDELFKGCHDDKR